MEGVIAVQEYFIKMGSEYFAARDIFDQNGVLLLGKGQKVTTNIKKRLGILEYMSMERLADREASKVRCLKHATGKVLTSIR